MSLLAKKSLVGIDLGSTTIKIVGMRKKNKAFNLEFYEVVNLVKEYAIDSLDDLTDELYIDQLRLLVKRYDIKNACVSTMLPAGASVIHTVRLKPGKSEQEIVETIQAEIQQVTTIPLDEMYISCHQLESASSQQHIDLLACCVAKSTVERYRAIFDAIGLKLAILDLDALSVYNAFYYFLSKPVKVPFTLVQIGSQYTICLIKTPGKNPFFNIISMGGNQLTTGIMQELSLSFCKADKYKKRVYTSKWTVNSNYADSRLAEIYREFAHKMAEDIKKCIRHYQSIEGVKAIDNIFLTGGGAQLEPLVDTFAEQLHRRVRIWNPLTHFQDEAELAEVTHEQGIHLTPTIGTLLRS